MNYDEATHATVTAALARREVLRHGLDWAEFVHDCGNKPSYSGKTVLDWLGY